MMLFNKDNHGAAEIVAVLGLIDDRLPFDKWAPIIPLGLRDLKAIIGGDVLAAIDALYRAAEPPSAAMAEVVRLAQQAAAMFTWLRVIPTLEAQHGSAGRGKRLGENEHGLTAAQEFKDEDNIRSMAYEAVDALIEILDTVPADFWQNSEKCKGRQELLIRDKETFDRYYIIGSHRLYVTLMPIIREVQDAQIIPIITRPRYEALIQGDESLTQLLIDQVRRPLALLTMKKAVERLPVEVLPEGIVQVQQSATVRDKLRAEKSARDAVAASLGSDAAAMLDRLTDTIRELDALNEEIDFHTPGPTLQSRGITF